MRVLAILVPLMLAGCSTSEPLRPPTASTGLSGKGCEGFTHVVGTQGEAWFVEVVEEPTARSALQMAGYALSPPEQGVTGRDPSGDEFSLRAGGERPTLYTVTYPWDRTHPHPYEGTPEAWLNVSERFNASVAHAESALGWTRAGQDWTPVLISGIRCPTVTPTTG